MSNPNDVYQHEEFMLKFQKPGMGTQAAIEAYDVTDNAGLYDEASKCLCYKGPRYCADMVAGLFSVNKDHVTILDVAAGTGLVGEELKKRGFQNVHALEASIGMLEIARSKGHYSHYLLAMVTEGKQLPLLNASYDAITLCGATLENHLPPAALEEFVRLIKPGGYFINVVRASSLVSADYGKQYENKALELEENGKWALYGRMK
ncbi:methyltransferase-like protein 27, partial [Physella acuta]|uniref:methyltransferase-like protein 27 n=1 Tax=Physella acuta TaxID=109671 RepID=UPI0027DBEC72